VRDGRVVVSSNPSRASGCHLCGVTSCRTSAEAHSGRLRSKSCRRAAGAPLNYVDGDIVLSSNRHATLKSLRESSLSASYAARNSSNVMLGRQ
jgi:hypothetical protein